MKEKVLQEILLLLRHQRLGEAFVLTENYMLMHQQGQMEKFNALKNDFQLMTDYWLRGYNDPMRQKIYHRLLHSLYLLIAEIDINSWIKDNPYLKSISQTSRQSRSEWSVTSIRHELEEFVSESALLQLEPDHVRTARAEKLYSGHQQYLSHLFNYIITSRQWKESVASAFIDMLLSPTIDAIDQQLIVSAVTLSAMQTFDFQKVRMLMEVYRRTADEQIRQRSLVGWVLSIDDTMFLLYEALPTMVKELCEDERCREELTEIQMQFFYCLDAEKDTRKIKDEIMPDLMNGNNLKITPHGLAEIDEDSLEAILYPDKAEQNMERMEQSMHRMVDMQKQGADIYFGGFSQMKRFPFFSEISNWFVPYYPQHPAVSSILGKARGKNFLEIITRVGAFCDSDKYSFVLAYEQVLERIPESMMKLIDEGEATPIPVGGEISKAEQSEPAFIRRMYLQNLYRFYRLFPMREVFRNPFRKKVKPDYLIFANNLFNHTDLQKNYMQVVNFLMKRKLYDETLLVMSNADEMDHDFSYYVTIGTLSQHGLLGNLAEAERCFVEAYNIKPENDRVVYNLGRVYFAEGKYDKAHMAFDMLMKWYPDHKGYQLNAAVCLSRLSKYEDALKLLYKLNYENSDDINVNRVLAWTLTLAGKYDQAKKLYGDMLNSHAEPTAEDILNYGQCMWFSGQLDGAKALFVRFVNMKDDGMKALRDEFQSESYKILLSHGISDFDIQLMLDAISL